MPSTGWSVEQLRDYFDRTLEDRDRLHAQRAEYDKRALDTALETNNKRLDDMNEFREALSDQASRMMRRTESEIAIQALSDRVEADMRPLALKIEQIGKTNWPLFMSFISMFLALVAGVWLIIGLKIDASEAPILLSQEQLKVNAASLARQVSDNSAIATRLSGENLIASQTLAQVSATQTSRAEMLRQLEARTLTSFQADITSQNDRRQLNDRVTNIERTQAANSAERREATAVNRAKLIEIETQFKAMSDTLNVNKDEQERWLAIFYKKLFQETMPVGRFRPDLYNK